jgi:hypothetical protein
MGRAQKIVWANEAQLICISITRILLYIFLIILQIYTTVLKFIKIIHQPLRRTAVSRSRRTPRRLHPNRRGPWRLVAVHGGWRISTAAGPNRRGPRRMGPTVVGHDG